MSLDLAVLGFLSEAPQTGYDLKRGAFTGPVRAFWTADQAQIYRTLSRLRDDRLVKAMRKRQASRPDRLVFEITDAGRQRLHDLAKSSEPLPPLRDPFLLQLFFGADLSDAELERLLVERRDDYRSRLADLEHWSEQLAGVDLPPRQSVLKQTALDGAVSQQRAMVEWLEECLRAVQHSALPEAGQDVSQYLLGS